MLCDIFYYIITWPILLNYFLFHISFQSSYTCGKEKNVYNNTKRLHHSEQQEKIALVVIKPQNYSRCSSNAKEALPTKHGEGFIVNWFMKKIIIKKRFMKN